ncbi:AzlD domain-containing protein [Actinoalloteichus sp. AHMU CJ021]|uniref:Branched-chain amino acid transport protein (AzlD) n=1 Tax=Actinoalloteichus caeruleus DSM 43889 TaxID=1120930 RepID=A0ABT1JH23_ACTCY|nr:AzlD domain-containing protein [Actinoalloteichus caeruleus]AUS77609.1 AzlD domain-containing protein [Actinoalloteichus sp. AHMU CJ021]MCP2331499.1 Branched-chain amino acid transport protein (AzlD) [Actinoalloteichus caeruleus DSM 43889]
MTVTTIVLLAVGTYAFRVAGPLLRDRVRLSEAARRGLAVAATTLLTALMATAALTEGPGFAGWARPIGVAVGGLLAWRRAPFVVVVLAAAGTAAGLRLLGLP